MAIIGSLPITLANGTLADATQVMSDFNYIVSQVNSNAAALTGGNSISGTQTIAGQIQGQLGAVGTPTYSFIGDATTGMYGAGGGVINFSSSGVLGLQFSTSQISAISPFVFAPWLGAVGTPSYSFTGDLNTGMWSPGADTIAASTGGSERFRVDSSGNVGIGTTSTGGFRFVVASPNGTASDLTVTQSGQGTFAWQMPASTNALRLWTGTTELFRFTNDGRIFGTALHNNAGSVTGTANQYIASGTYTPTCVNVSGISSNTPTACQWIRVGNVVTVSGKITITITSTTNELRMSIPIASTLGAQNNLGGTGAVDATSGVSGAAACFRADTVNNAASMITPLGSGSPPIYFSFTYVVL